MHKAAGIRTQSGIIAETTAESILLRPAVTLPVNSTLRSESPNLMPRNPDWKRLLSGADCCRDGGALNARLLELEGRRGRLWQGLYRRSPDPRVLGLADLLRTRV